jgi:hypothetical protein
MLEILGTIAGNVLSLPGILGLALGMMTRTPVFGAIAGVIVGIAQTLVFAHMSFSAIAPLDLIISVIVGGAAGTVGSLVRRKGASV